MAGDLRTNGLAVEMGPRPSGSREPPSRSVARLWFVVGASGWAFAIVVWIVGWQIGVFGVSGDVLVFLLGGHAFWSGGNPYDAAVTPPGQPFLYAPPWAALFGIAAPLGPIPVHALLSALELLALRYVAGSWLRAGAVCWFLLVPWEIAAGQMNLLVTAAIVAAARGRPGAAAVMGMAKVSPALAAHPRDWRPFLIAALAFGALSLPRLDLWPAWIAQLLSVMGAQPGPVVPVPFLLRLPVGLALILVGRPWSRALGAAIALPGLYWGALVVFIAPLAVIAGPRPVARGDPATGQLPAGSPRDEPIHVATAGLRAHLNFRRSRR